MKSMLIQADGRHAKVIDSIKKDIDDIPAILQRMNTDSDDTTNTIQSKSKQLKSTIDVIAQKMSDLCKSQYKHSQSELTEREITLKEKLKVVTSFRNSIDTLLKCEDRLDVIHKGQVLMETNSDKPIYPQPEQASFTPKQEDMSDISNIIGQVKIADIPIPNPYDVEKASDILGSLRRSRQLKMKASFRHSLTAGILQICPSIQDQSLLACWAEHVIKSVNESGKILRSIPIRSQPSSISYQNGVIFLASFLEKCVIQIDPTDKLDTLFETDLHPNGLCCLSSSMLLVSLLEHGDHHPSECSKRLLTKCTVDGKQVITVERDGQGKRLFNWPIRVRTNTLNDLILVVNETGTESSHIVMLDNNLTYELRYLGNGKVIRCDQDFHPADIISDFYVEDVDFDSQNNLVIAEYHSKSIHFLNTCCTRLKSIATFTETMWSLAIHQNNDIWIGFENGVVRVMR
ncbi:uncharacterized protein LOC132549260 [Ylistrum balloti]|uniref:uncharacterized protein LOC132549260 n=1 Tax=Ylistrum balloti TaxID=509963 RepID=UPI002905E735|nr:uncharacterized protein LOC132549260 [Ylistrum balloti]